MGLDLPIRAVSGQEATIRRLVRRQGDGEPNFWDGCPSKEMKYELSRHALPKTTVFSVDHCLESPTDPERSHFTVGDLHPLSRRVRNHDCSSPVAVVKDREGIIANHEPEPRVQVEWALLDVEGAAAKV